MENSPGFDLNEAVRRWRTHLEQSPALRDADVKELETHLRDSVLTLQARGLDAEESFLIASRRMGHRHELEREFGKANPERLWMDRGLWMLAGLVLFSLVSWCSGFLSHTIRILALAMSLDAHWSVFLSTLAGWIFFALAVAGFWRLVTRRHERLGQFARLCLRRPLLPIIAIVALNYSYHPVVQWLINVTALAARPEMSRMVPIWTTWEVWGYYCLEVVKVVLWMAALIYLARRQWQISESASRERNVHTIEDLESSLCEPARALLSKGLSVEEAAFLVTRRQGLRQELTSEREAASLRQVWIERGLWMIVSVVLNMYFISYLPFLSQRLTLNLANSWSVNGHLLGFFSVCLQWAAVATVVAGLWRLISRRPTLGPRIASFIHGQPILGMIALVLLNVGFSALLWLLVAKVMPEAPSSYGNSSGLVLRWNEYGRQFLYNVVSVMLLFWLARHRLKFQEAR